MSIKSYVWRLRSRTEVVLVLILVTAYVGAFQYFRQTSFRDPTSAFPIRIVDLIDSISISDNLRPNILSVLHHLAPSG